MFLVILTVAGVLVNGFLLGRPWSTVLIMCVAFAKYLLVAFYFMELRKAHNSWKFVTVVLGGLIVLVVILVVAGG
ncbi:hypothetical protein ADIS_3527 [Lunatimonas lonarensis]|uniref:Cytochrome c oxidase subunit IV n=1 Tax=Lunatimonas lonarensis TaxID=1232681 RepID=R7ZPI8_9BACT|nr:hypothetical protein ADIS_3527 [Lunatimonas lonarensis]